MKEMTTSEKLLKWAEIVEKAPDDKFDMSAWCGTACCAAGWLLKSRFGKKRLGLSFDDANQIRLNSEQVKYNREAVGDYSDSSCAIGRALGVSDHSLVPIIFAFDKTKKQIVAKIRALAKVYA